VPLYVSLHSMSATLKCTPPSATLFRSAVVNAGYRISGSHANPLGLKTDAPMAVLWDIMRCWVCTINLSLSFIEGPPSKCVAERADYVGLLASINFDLRFKWVFWSSIFVEGKTSRYTLFSLQGILHHLCR
jgi:hypothetical protein